MAEDVLQVYQGSVETVTTQLHVLGGSPGCGARPKATIGLNSCSNNDLNGDAIADTGDLPENYDHWLVKFPTGTNKQQQAEGAADGSWSLSPAYDVTFNTGINGHHSMSIVGHGKKVPYEAIQKIADLIPLQKTQVKIMIAEITESLSNWKKLAQDHNIPTSITKEIGSYIDTELSQYP